MNRPEILKKYEQVFEIYKDPVSRSKIAEAEDYLLKKQFDLAEKVLTPFKTEEQLLNALEEKLNGKPIHKTLKKIRNGVVENKSQLLKGLFSLGTHAMIEVESGKTEYSYIAKRIHEKIGDLMNS